MARVSSQGPTGTLFDDRGNWYRARLQTLIDPRAWQGRSIVVLGAHGQMGFRIEGMFDVREPDAHDTDELERRLLAEAASRLRSGRWRKGETYQAD